ncbi:MAG: sigma factor-like helix-turn-helix DNA-binding protein [Candidatus Buchananbacteria bacterium]
MDNQNSILDKIIESQEKRQASQFNPNELVGNLLKNLSNKESDILSRRFGILGKKKETLEEIGKYYEITRERIRQIEMATIKKLKEIKSFRQNIETAEQHITHLLENHGGIMEENFLLDEIGYNDESQNQSVRFILNHLINDKIDAIKTDDDLLNAWKLPVLPTTMVKELINELVEIINLENKLLKLEDLLNHLQSRDFYSNNKGQILSLKLGASQDQLEKEIDQVIHSYLKVAKNIDQNILGEWGLSSWNSISPKRMSDKIYLVLRKAEKPLHFVEITDLINQSGFDKKTAYPATIHNELILDERFVLVGRGIYALKEWGYKNGTVIDIIVDILKNSDQPMSKEDITKAVLDQRIVRKSTIDLALTNKKIVKKTADGKFTLNTETSS